LEEKQKDFMSVLEFREMFSQLDVSMRKSVKQKLVDFETR